jgi:4-hydroxythreonine-4-phosphate dehydrogenase
MTIDSRPRLAITLGDVAGIGPEIIVRALTEGGLTSFCRPLIVGHPKWLLRARSETSHDLDFGIVEHPAEPCELDVTCWNPAGDDVLAVVPGQIQAAAGRAAYEYLVAAARAALGGQVDAITTAPLHKEALRLAGLDYPGHTEILAAECGVHEVAMMLYLPPGVAVRGRHGLGVAHVTLHTSIASVPGLLSVDRIFETVALLDNFLRQLNGPPQIGVCALNPHAGEHGLFGDEEARLIEPAVRQARQAGIAVEGPIPADALLRRAVAGEFDGVVAMYHDQGHIALKLIGWDLAVNITLGLPIIRTSPSHGTAFDIAGKGVARADGFIAAARVACQLVASQNRRPDHAGAARDQGG